MSHKHQQLILSFITSLVDLAWNTHIYIYKYILHIFGRESSLDSGEMHERSDRRLLVSNSALVSFFVSPQTRSILCRYRIPVKLELRENPCSCNAVRQPIPNASTTTYDVIELRTHPRHSFCNLSLLQIHR